MTLSRGHGERATPIRVLLLRVNISEDASLRHPRRMSNTTSKRTFRKKFRISAMAIQTVDSFPDDEISK